MLFKLPQLKLNSFYTLSIALFSLMVCFVFYQKTEDDCVPGRLQIYLEVEDVFNVTKYNINLKLEVLLENLKERNKQCEVRNWNKFGPITSDTPAVVVTVRRDLDRLQHLVLSLAQVGGIQMLLLIFSHSFYDEKINHLIRKIDFCMVLQIFYPNSVQLHPNRFPGVAPDDCTERTLDANGSCTERDMSTEPKHHWWWTATFVFEQLPWAETHEDMVIFIDEESYVLPDFLYMFRMLKKSLAYVSDASVLSFGRPLANGLHYDKLIVEAWRPHYKGLAFNKTTWRRISALGKFYCQYDDTSWSYSLMYLFERFPGGRAVMVVSVLPRVVSTGVFRSGRQALQNICLMTSRDQLYPRKVQVVMLYGHDGRLINQPKAPPTGNGGWSKGRDRMLCFHALSSSTTLSPPQLHLLSWRNL